MGLVPQPPRRAFQRKMRAVLLDRHTDGQG